MKGIDKFEVGRLRESLSSRVSLFVLGTGNKMIFLCSEQELRGQKWNKGTLIFWMWQNTRETPAVWLLWNYFFHILVPVLTSPVTSLLPATETAWHLPGCYDGKNEFYLPLAFQRAITCFCMRNKRDLNSITTKPGVPGSTPACVWRYPPPPPPPPHLLPIASLVFLVDKLWQESGIYLPLSFYRAITRICLWGRSEQCQK